MTVTGLSVVVLLLATCGNNRAPRCDFPKFPLYSTPDIDRGPVLMRNLDKTSLEKRCSVSFESDVGNVTSRALCSTACTLATSWAGSGNELAKDNHLTTSKAPLFVKFHKASNAPVTVVAPLGFVGMSCGTSLTACRMRTVFSVAGWRH